MNNNHYILFTCLFCLYKQLIKMSVLYVITVYECIGVRMRQAGWRIEASGICVNAYLDGLAPVPD